jgi:hypothetical protein
MRIKPTYAPSSNFIGITTPHVSGSLSAQHQEFLTVHRHWYNLCSLVTECYHAQDGTYYDLLAINSYKSITVFTDYGTRVKYFFKSRLLYFLFCRQMQL